MTDPIRNEIARQVAADLLSIRAVFLRPEDPFTWASGIKSPIYCDNRLILSHPRVRDRVEDALAEVAGQAFGPADMLMGTATAGIAHAALCAGRLDLPMGYVRASAKDHGRGGQIEGAFQAGQRTVVIEDLVSTGGSSVAAATTLVEANLNVLGVVAIFTYNMERAARTFADASVPYTALTNLDTLVEVAETEGYLPVGQGAEILRFRDNPAAWWKETV